MTSDETRPEVCQECGGAIDWIDAPTGGWWAHETHPQDGHDAAPDETRPDRDALRERLRDEIAHWPIGTGYYRTNIGTDEAGEIADAVLSVVDEEVARLRAALDDIHWGGAHMDVRTSMAGMNADLTAERDALKAENKRLRKAVSHVVARMGTRKIDHRHEDETGHMGVKGRAYFYQGDIYDDWCDLRAALDTPEGEKE